VAASLRQHWLRALALIAFLVLLGAVPRISPSPYVLTVGVFIALNAMVVFGLSLLMGYAGQISLGHGAFYGLGAYVSAIATTRSSHPLNPWLGIVLGMALTGVLAWLVGRPTLRLRGHYLAMATLGLGIIIQIVFQEATGLTQGHDGISGIPALTLGSFELNSDARFYYLAWPVALLVMLLSWNIVNSRVGRALRAIHDSELAAATSGVDTARCKVQIFVLSAIYASLAGSLYAHYIRYISPNTFGFSLSISLVVMVVVGGSRSLWGVLIGTALMTVLRELLLKLGAAVPKLEHSDVVLFGLILMLVVIFAPQGLASLPRRLAQFGRRRAATNA
jgi:branched-chain amino acid transport system permease protein